MEENIELLSFSLQHDVLHSDAPAEDTDADVHVCPSSAGEEEVEVVAIFAVKELLQRHELVVVVSCVVQQSGEVHVHHFLSRFAGGDDESCVVRGRCAVHESAGGELEVGGAPYVVRLTLLSTCGGSGVCFIFGVPDGEGRIVEEIVRGVRFVVEKECAVSVDDADVIAFGSHAGRVFRLSERDVDLFCVSDKFQCVAHLISFFEGHGVR